jgi:hypothetical protein
VPAVKSSVRWTVEERPTLLEIVKAPRGSAGTVLRAPMLVKVDAEVVTRPGDALGLKGHSSSAQANGLGRCRPETIGRANDEGFSRRSAETETHPARFRIGWPFRPQRHRISMAQAAGLG